MGHPSRTCAISSSRLEAAAGIPARPPFYKLFRNTIVASIKAARNRTTAGAIRYWPNCWRSQSLPPTIIQAVMALMRSFHEYWRWYESNLHYSASLDRDQGKNRFLPAPLKHNAKAPTRPRVCARVSAKTMIGLFEIQEGRMVADAVGVMGSGQDDKRASRFGRSRRWGEGVKTVAPRIWDA
jgi:hypothetical protein